MPNNTIKKFHFGVYGVAKHNGKILVVHKSRGPYKSLFDLPGGRPKHGESIKGTLRREFHEETGIVIQRVSFLKKFSLIVPYQDPDCSYKELHHSGSLYTVHNINILQHKPSIILEDVEGSSWVDLHSLTIDQCSPLVVEIKNTSLD